jgi:hypothetical protein
MSRRRDLTPRARSVRFRSPKEPRFWRCGRPLPPLRWRALSRFRFSMVPRREGKTGDTAPGWPCYSPASVRRQDLVTGPTSSCAPIRCRANAGGVTLTWNR